MKTTAIPGAVDVHLFKVDPNAFLLKLKSNLLTAPSRFRLVSNASLRVSKSFMMRTDLLESKKRASISA